jgi:NADH-quinone oxidoreductase subunit L
VENIYLTIVLAPLFGAIVAGLFGKVIGRSGAHWVAILGVATSFVLSVFVFKYMVIDGGEPFNGPVYTWMVSEGFNMEVGFLVDRLTTLGAHLHYRLHER